MLTTSVILPMVEQAGIDPLWFGIYVVIVVEMSQITPPRWLQPVCHTVAHRPQYFASRQGRATVLYAAFTSACIDHCVSQNRHIPPQSDGSLIGEK